MSIKNLLYKMQQNAADEGKITLSVSIDMTTEWIPDGNGESEECQKPKFKYKVDYSVPVKEGVDEKKDPGMKIVYDEHLRKFVLKYVNEGGQMSMFDDEIQVLRSQISRMKYHQKTVRILQKRCQMIMSMKIQRRVCRNEKRESTGQLFTVPEVWSADHICADEIRKEYAS